MTCMNPNIYHEMVSLKNMQFNILKEHQVSNLSDPHNTKLVFTFSVVNVNVIMNVIPVLAIWEDRAAG